MRNILKKVKAKNRTYKKAYKSTYSETLKWRIILPEEVYNKLQYALENNPPKFNFKDEIGLYYLSLISHIPSYKKDKTYPGGYVNLNAKKMEKVSGNYLRYINYFVDNNIIERKDSYSNEKGNGFSKSFRYKDSDTRKFTWKIIEYDVLKSTYEKIELKEKKLCKEPVYISKWINENLTIDSDAVIQKIQEKLTYTIPNELNTMKKAENYLRSLKNLHFKEFWSSRDKKSDNRYHSNLTNMPKIFRKWIKYDEKKIAGVDIKNSQPFFLILLIERIKNWELKGSRMNVRKKIERMLGKVESKSSGTMFDTLLEALNSSAFQEEFKVIKDNILRGIFYDNLEPHFEFEKNITGKFEKKFYSEDVKKRIYYYFDSKRDVIKRLVLFFLYKANQKEPNKEDKDYLTFKNLYPNFCNVLELLKQNDKRDLPKLLQHLEADCVLDYTCKLIAEKYPSMPLFTIHDSINTTDDYIELLEEETLKHITEYCNGTAPTLKTEYWSDKSVEKKSA